MWCPSSAARKKVLDLFKRESLSFQSLDSDRVLVDGDWERLRDLAVPLRRVLTRFEADDLRVLFKADGSDPSLDDFRKVYSLTQFSVVGQSGWLNELLREQRLTAVYQPIVYASDPSRIFAREALMRGFARNAAVIYPGHLLETARACNMLAIVDHAARTAALEGLVRGEVQEKIFVNISAGSAHDPTEAVDSTARVVDAAGIAHDRVVFELTETDETLDPGMLLHILDAYRTAGFGVALDDVGSGYSSLNLLHQLRPDFIKVDMEIIRGVHTDGYKALIAEKILEIAKSLGIRTIAEGIEKPEELAWVQAHGADFVQGYLIARPNEPTFRG